jgi:CYTH domain-containing protein
MGLEIERKFIVPLSAQSIFVTRPGGTRQVQAYLSDDPARTVRVRLTETPHGTSATMTVKGKPRHGGMAKPEWEWDMPPALVQDMIRELNPPLLDKTRHFVNYRGATWEVDVLRVLSAAARPPSHDYYLVTAEVEMPTIEEAHAVALPPWVGQEVTGDKTYAMSMLTTETARKKAWAVAYGA